MRVRAILGPQRLQDRLEPGAQCGRFILTDSRRRRGAYCAMVIQMQP
jgi:hypothetical protein